MVLHVTSGCPYDPPHGSGISEVLPFAIGVAISPIPIIAVILMLFSNRAKVNGPAFLLGG